MGQCWVGQVAVLCISKVNKCKKGSSYYWEESRLILANYWACPTTVDKKTATPRGAIIEREPIEEENSLTGRRANQKFIAAGDCF